MIRAFAVGAIALALAVAAPTRVAAQEFNGTWKLSRIDGGAFGTFEQAFAVVKVKVADQKATGELVTADPRLKLALKSISLDKHGLNIVLRNVNTDLTFQFAPPTAEGTPILGSVAQRGTLYPSRMLATDLTKLAVNDVTARLVDCPPMRQARELAVKPFSLRNAAQRAKDPDQKKSLMKQAVEADAVAKKETPALYREVLAKHADSPAVFASALNLLRAARTSGAKVEEVQPWAATAAKAARAYGPRWQGDFAGQLAVILISQDGMENLALHYARNAEKALTPEMPAESQVRTLSLLTRALRKNGKNDEAKPLETRIAKLDEILDREYTAKMPPFKGAAFTGRKSKSERAVLLELFTGATCPPCVAADLAFDVLTKTYKPRELVLIQYHMHIPGPDPLTNADTEARWAYYTKAFPGKVRGVPSSIFNGKPAAGGGGGVANAEAKYDKYRDVIDPLLEEPAGAKLSAHVHRKGDRIDISIDIADLVGPGSAKKLRILLAEESVRYPGSNKIRFHHHVVRAFPGGVKGVALTNASSKHTASIDLATLRGSLTKYLNEFEAGGRSFLNPARPMEFNDLRVIAFVQDDDTHEILQAVQVNVGKK